MLGIAIADIISECERKHGSSLDANLINIQYNEKIEDILDDNKIEIIFFTSRYVEVKFKQKFSSAISKHPEIKLSTLPSPSPRYALMSKAQKVLQYKNMLPGKG